MQPARGSSLMHHILIGMTDGLIIPLALVSGLSAAEANEDTIIGCGFIAAIAGALTMGIGGYYSGKEEEHDDHSLPQKTPEEARAFFSRLGMSEAQQELAFREISKDREQWEQILQEDKASSTLSTNPTQSGIQIGISYFIGGLIPVLPYLFLSERSALFISFSFSLLLLLVLGALKATYRNGKIWMGAIVSMLSGGFAAAGAYAVARIFIHT